MEQTNTPQQPSRKKAILSLLVLLALTCVVAVSYTHLTLPTILLV